MRDFSPEHVAGRSTTAPALVLLRVPVLDRVPAVEGLIVATGMSAHGFGIGPGYGEILARMATGEDNGTDMHRIRSNRFSDGSRHEFGPEL